MKKMTVVQAAFLAKQADRLFSRAASAWVRGNNSGNGEALRRGESQCDRYRRQAEAMLTPLGIVVDYPGLYPSFTVNGFAEHSTLNAISAALEGNAMKSRADYMNHTCTHREYYGQFVTPAILKRVEQHIGLDRIKRSTDEHMNDIPLSLWDGMYASIAPAILDGLKTAGDTLSLSSVVCVSKEAAKQIKESLTR